MEWPQIRRGAHAFNATHRRGLLVGICPADSADICPGVDTFGYAELAGSAMTSSIGSAAFGRVWHYIQYLFVFPAHGGACCRARRAVRRPVWM
jgi:hypothetical protein